MKVIVFGAGKFGKYLIKYFDNSDEYNIVAVVDSEKVGVQVCGHKVIAPSKIKEYEYDFIYVTPVNVRYNQEISDVLKSINIHKNKIRYLRDDVELIKKAVTGSVLYEESDIRVNWLKNYSIYAKQKNIKGCVAECGVDKGDFAYYINKYFDDKTCYLFDTFTGFAQNDLKREQSFSQDAFLKGSFNQLGNFKYTSEDIVYEKMPNKDNIVIKKGYFPETANDLPDNEFCFVNLDMDLYNPTIEGLRFFHERLVSGGVILCHDYFHPELPGVRKAVDEFCNDHEVNCIPIGDNCSIAVLNL